MRGNPVKQKLAGGQLSVGTFVTEFDSPGLMQMAAAAGAEFLLFDMEHSAFSMEQVRRQMAYARGLNIVPMVRVPTGQYHFIARCLDAGALGIMVPMVESPEQARQIAEAVQYPPQGRRGAIFGAAHDDFETADLVETMKQANQRTLLIAQIESERGLEHAEAIIATPGVDVAWVGHFDLSNFLGIPGQFQSYTFLDARAKVAELARTHGKAAGVLAANVEWGREWIAAGYNAVAYGSDIGLYQQSLAAGIAQLAQPRTKPRLSAAATTPPRPKKS